MSKVRRASITCEENMFEAAKNSQSSSRRTRLARPKYDEVESYALDLIDENRSSEFDSDDEEKKILFRTAFKRKPKTSFDSCSGEAVFT